MNPYDSAKVSNKVISEAADWLDELVVRGGTDGWRDIPYWTVERELSFCAKVMRVAFVRNVPIARVCDDEMDVLRKRWKQTQSRVQVHANCRCVAAPVKSRAGVPEWVTCVLASTGLPLIIMLMYFIVKAINE